MNLKHQTLTAWLRDLAGRNETDQDDEGIIKYAVHQLKIPVLKVTCGLVYFKNGGIATFKEFSQLTLEALEKAGIIQQQEAAK